jgi:hypothetical protein
MDKALTDTTCLQGADDVVFTAMEDEAVLLHLGTRKYYGLNETGLRIWQMIQVGASLGDIATTLSNEYEVDVDEAREAVVGLCGELLDEGLVQVGSSSGGSGSE